MTSNFDDLNVAKNLNRIHCAKLEPHPQGSILYDFMSFILSPLQVVGIINVIGLILSLLSLFQPNPNVPGIILGPSKYPSPLLYRPRLPCL